ncbi:MAG: HD domain-containing protein [Lachnospiraceae bacterium]|nr:HD domain-containing protein [Lachnospiraceae bacterium]
MNERLKQQMKFALELDKEKRIGRQTYLSGAIRKENDAEHAWHLALMTMLLSEYANEEIDVLRTMSMVIIHDVIEIDAGDTYAYDDAGNATKRERELKAANRIFSMLPEDQAEYFRKLWDEFEEGTSKEAKFAHAMDAVQPIMLNDATDGLAWREHQVAQSKVRQRAVHKIKPGSEVLFQYINHLIDKNVEKGNLKED